MNPDYKGSAVGFTAKFGEKKTTPPYGGGSSDNFELLPAGGRAKGGPPTREHLLRGRSYDDSPAWA